MAESSHRWLAVPVIFSVIDNLVNILSLGFYHRNFSFNATVLEEQLFFTNGYSILSSGFDFFLLSLLRFVIFSVSIYLIFKRLRFQLFVFDYVLSITYLLTISFSLIKILCFSEIEEQLKYAGVFMSVFSTLGLSTIHFILWFAYLKKHKKEQNEDGYTRMVEDIPNQQSTSEQSTNEPSITEERSSALTQVGRIYEYTAMHGRWFFGGFVFLLIFSGAKIFIPYYTGQVIAEIVKTDHSESNFLRLILIMSGLSALSAMAGGFRGNCQKVSSTVALNLNVFLRNVVMIVGSLIFMFFLSWRLTFVTFIAVPPITLVTKVYGQYFDRLSQKTQDTVAEGNRVAEEAIGTMRTVRSFACENKEAERFEEKLQATLEISKKQAVAYLGYTWINELSEKIILISVLFYAGHLAIKGQLTVNQATSFLLYQMQLGENFTNINNVFSGLMESVGASRKAFEYINRKPAIKYEGTNEQPINGDVVFESVNFSYPTRETTEVLKNLTLKISAGQTVALVGPSGAGKSSCVALLEHFYETNSGRILVDGVEITQYKHSHYHQQISLVSQEPILYSGSIRENILYGCEEWATDSDMIRASKLANAHNFISELKDGYDTKCGEKGVMMSGGQKQRIAIARALVRNPSILILDEATSALDGESEHIIQQALQKCSVGRTVIIIAHRLSTVENSDLIYVINKGEVVQQGNHMQLMEEDGVYKTLVQRQLLRSETIVD